MGVVVGVVAGARARSVRQLSEQRRAWNARTISLSLCILGLLTGGILFFLPSKQVLAPIVWSVHLTALANLGAYLLIRRGSISLGSFVMLLVSNFQHVFIANNREAALVTPFFASIFVMIGATCVTRKWLAPVYALSVATVVAQYFVGRGIGLEEYALRGPYIAAFVLLSITCVVSWLHTSGLERAVELAQAREDERELLSIELEKAARMEALGRLAGGIAHDFNNLLVVVQGSAELAKDELSEEHPAWEEISQIQGAARRAADLTGQLLAFSRRQLVPTARISPAEVLSDLVPLLSRLIGSRLSLDTEVRDQESTILASSTQLEQVILNLTANARDASPEKGRVKVSLGRCKVNEGEANDLPAGIYVEIAVTDFGMGISEEVKEHLFEPFFTTKPAGQGTGLGLATSFGIIHQMGGTIVVESEVGVGSTFRILLPPANESEKEVPVGSSVQSPVKRALVVDDDDRVRQLVRKVFEAAGTVVFEASDAENCVRVAKEEKDLDLIITDIVLSGRSGMQILSDLKNLHPRARLVVMSSFSPERHVRAQLDALGAIYLSKPFSPATLTEIALGTGGSGRARGDAAKRVTDSEPPDTSRSG